MLVDRLVSSLLGRMIHCFLRLISGISGNIRGDHFGLMIYNIMSHAQREIT